MSVFEACKTFHMAVPNLDAVAQDVMDHFRQQEFEVTGERRITGGWDISLSRGNIFKMVCGLRSALKIEIEPQGPCTWAKAHVGIFGQQVIPTIVMWCFFWPVLVTQIWGLVKQAKLDQEAIQVIEESLTRHANAHEAAPVGAITPGSKFCAGCGHRLPPGAAFCPECGQKLG